MSKKNVIHVKNMPTRIPISLYGVIWLLMDKYHAPQVAYGAFYTMVGLLVLAFIYAKYNEKYVDVSDVFRAHGKIE